MPRTPLAGRPLTAAERARRYREGKRRKKLAEVPELERDVRLLIARIIAAFVYEVKETARRPNGDHHLGPAGQKRLAELLQATSDQVTGDSPWRREEWARLRREAEAMIFGPPGGERVYTPEVSRAIREYIEQRLPAIR